MSHRLAPLLVKWLTHDLAGPLATMLTASELLSDTADAEINGLVTDSARRLAARLRLVRAALAPGDAPIGGAALERLVREGIDGTPVIWELSCEPGDGETSAIVAGAALLLADLRRGVPLTITGDGAAWATPAALPDSVVAALGGEPASDARAAVAATLTASARRVGRTLTATADGILWHAPAHPPAVAP